MGWVKGWRDMDGEMAEDVDELHLGRPQAVRD
jgi:hypothetical protein